MVGSLIPRVLVLPACTALAVLVAGHEVPSGHRAGTVRRYDGDVGGAGRLCNRRVRDPVPLRSRGVGESENGLGG